jgi:hypothetical protein
LHVHESSSGQELSDDVDVTFVTSIVKGRPPTLR